jgi:hypothetical protein
MPAGTVLVVMVLALGAAAVVGRAGALGPGDPGGDPGDAARIEAGAGARSPAGQPTVAAPAGRAGAAGDGTPRLRAPTPDRPLRLWVGGDAVAGELAAGLTRLTGRTRLFEVEEDVRPSTGLSHPDHFDWPDHLRHEVVPSDGGGADPDVLVVMFGADDEPPGPGSPGGPADPADSRAWLDRYRRRVAETMDLLRGPKEDRLVIWAGMPVTEAGAHGPVGPMNAVFASEAARRPWVRYFDAYPFLADPFGRYAPALANADGRTEEVRAADGVGLTPAGGLRLARAVHARLATLVDLRAAPLPDDPSQSAPPNIAERPYGRVAAG